LIISGGENIYPAEVERVLTDHPSVAEAAVIGRPDAKWQEVPVAFVVCRAGAAIDDAVLKQHVAQHLARFKIPRDVIFVDTLPRNALGKVQHFRLREEVTTSPTTGRDGDR
jgi:fatty-acyl-CoA synthase